MALKSPEAQKRMFGRVFVCKKCKSKRKADVQKIIQKKITCKRCGSKSFRPIRKAK